MSALYQWLLSAPTAQMMVGGQYAQLVEELRRLWDGARVLKDLAPHREHLVKLTKRAKRAMPDWHSELEQSLREEKPSPKQLTAIEALLAEVRRVADHVLQHPPLGPAPSLDRAGYRKLVHAIVPSRRRILHLCLRRLPSAVVQLLAEQRNNAWLAAHLVDLFMDASVNPARLQTWLEDWSLRVRVPLPANESDAWRAWLTGQVRRPPHAAACFVTFCIGRIADAAGEMHPRVENAGEVSEQAVEPARAAVQPADPSRIYSIREAAEAFNLPIWRLRKAAQSGELKASRPTPSPNAPLQFRDSDIRDYLAAQAGNRQRAPKNPSLDKAFGGRGST